MRYYQVRYGGCNHSGILSETQLRTDAMGEQLNPVTMTKENTYQCQACLNDEPGACGETVLHGIESAKKLTLLEVRQLLSSGSIDDSTRDVSSNSSTSSTEPDNY